MPRLFHRQFGFRDMTIWEEEYKTFLMQLMMTLLIMAKMRLKTLDETSGRLSLPLEGTVLFSFYAVTFSGSLNGALVVCGRYIFVRN